MLGAVPSWEISITVLLVLAAVLGMSCATYATLVRRATSHRQWVALSEWGRDAGFRFVACDPERLPPPLDQLTARRPVVRICLGGPRGMLIEVQASAPDPEWHLMVRQIPNVWRPTGLRPAHQGHSFLDLYSLSSYPLLSDGERFLVFGTDSTEARRLSESMIRSLLPPDVGILLHGRTMVLDFSQRPFDPLEFDRMIALADQLAQRLPMPTA
jgi:hypothetical protein